MNHIYVVTEPFNKLGFNSTYNQFFASNELAEKWLKEHGFKKIDLPKELDGVFESCWIYSKSTYNVQYRLLFRAAMHDSIDDIQFKEIAE